jgi:hypothetical protein
MGYAVMMARSRSGLGNTPVGQTLRALLPYILAQCTVTTLVFLMPLTVHQLDAAPDAVLAPLSAEDLDQQMRDMATKE